MWLYFLLQKIHLLTPYGLCKCCLRKHNFFLKQGGKTKHASTCYLPVMAHSSMPGCVLVLTGLRQHSRRTTGRPSNLRRDVMSAYDVLQEDLCAWMHLHKKSIKSTENTNKAHLVFRQWQKIKAMISINREQRFENKPQKIYTAINASSALATPVIYRPNYKSQQSINNHPFWKYICIFMTHPY